MKNPFHINWMLIALYLFPKTCLAQDKPFHCETVSAQEIVTKASMNKVPVPKILLPHQARIQSDSLYTLPVVVHVIHTGGAIGSTYNPKDSLIFAMLDNLNKAWQKNGPNYGGVNMKVRFQLATKGPDCSPTTGITRSNGSGIANYTTGGIAVDTVPGSAVEVDVKSLSRWPNTDYINIWIVNKINGNPFAGGFTYFPELNQAAKDGLTLTASTVDGDNKTIVHEMGHYLFLYHTFEDGGYSDTCPINTDCTMDGDHICDTEPCKLDTCNSIINSCSNLPYIESDATKHYTVLNNYMGYTNCQWMFTQQQKDRARSALETFRPSLLRSKAFGTATLAAPSIACTPVAANALSPYYGVQRLKFDSLDVYSNSSRADGAFYVDRTCNQSTTVTKGSQYLLQVTGSYQNPHLIKVYIDYNNDGDFNDSGEILLDAYDGMAQTNVTIPLAGTKTGAKLRLRVVADNPNWPVSQSPTACQLYGNAAEGSGQIEDYAVIIKPRQIVSIHSGAWNVASNWSCDCVPQGDDQVTIKAPFTIDLTPAMGAGRCGDFLLEQGARFNVSGDFRAQKIL